MSSFAKYFLLATFLVTGVASAQIDTGTISGVVKDQSGAAIANASVTVTNTEKTPRSPPKPTRAVFTMLPT